jgi:hypothetical protein
VYGTANEKLLVLFPFLLTAFLFLKVSPRTSYLGAPAMAYVVGVSAAVMVGGAVFGTIFPQAWATINMLSLSNSAGVILNGIIILIGTIFTLIYFQFGARVTAEGTVRRFGVIEILAWVGRVFIAITLGALFAGVLLASITALIERIASWFTFLSLFF